MAWLLCSAIPAGALAAEPTSYDVVAQVSADRSRVEFVARIRVAVAAGDRDLRLWLHGDRLAVAPAAMDERSGRWIYPGEVSLGGYESVEVTVDGVPVEAQLVPLATGRDAGGSDLLVPVPARVADDGSAEVLVEVRATLVVPDRFGRLGRARGELALLAPWYPLVVGRDREGREGWSFAVPHHVVVEVDGGEVVLFDEATGVPVGTGPRAELDTVAAYVGALAAGTVHRASVRIGGTTLWMVGGAEEYRPRPADAEGIEGVEDFVAIDRLALVREVLTDVLATATWLGSSPPAMSIVTVRSRVELAGYAPGAVLISDRLFQVFPLDVVQEFHRRSLRRALFQEVAEHLGRDLETASDRGWTRDLRSVVLLELDELRRSATARRPEELLSLFSFHPAIDSLLYAPQITFEQAYFGAIDESDPFRDEPTRAREPLTGGRRLLECARDALDEDAFRRLVARWVRARRPARAALARVVGSPEAERLLSSWLAYAALAVNYRLGEISSERRGDGYVHRIEVFRDGDERVEPVQLEVEDAAGNRVSGTWDGHGDRGVVEIVTPAERGRVEIDPGHRLPQSAVVADGHPRADDATSQPFRLPILSAFALDLLLSEANFTGLVDFAIRQRYDLEHTVSARLFRTVARTGGRIRYIQGLGPKVHTNRRLGSVGGGLGLAYLQPGFGGSLLGGWALDLDVSASIDSRSYIFDPRGGYALVGQLVLSGTVREDGSFNLGARGGARGALVVPVGLLNAFQFVVGGGFTVGPALNADLQSLGGRNVLRGFANDEILGSGVVYGVMEHRITALPDLAVNVFHLAWLREVQLAWWLGVGGAFDTTDGRSAVFALEAGAGARFHYEYGGIQPGVLALDVGVPVSRFWDQPRSGRTPIGFYVSFDQYF